MNVFGAEISSEVIRFLKEMTTGTPDFNLATRVIYGHSGIVNFFENREVFHLLKNKISDPSITMDEHDRSEYGDFQTNNSLTGRVAGYLKAKGIKTKVVVEPTCGKGNFIIAALSAFPGLEFIYGIEIYQPYIWETKFKIVQYYLANSVKKKPEIRIENANVFEYDFKNIARQHNENDVLIIGNPPWVTNSKSGSINSNNLPVKSNFKKHNGFDAITGKGNFDIAEYISLMIFDAFQNSNGHFAFLVKNSVIKNIIFDQKAISYKIAGLQKHIIDSKKEFGVSVDASLFFCRLNATPEYDCKEYAGNSLDTAASDYSHFGWVGNKFVSDIEHYKETHKIDGTCQFIWRQGIKHDCSAVMELDRIDGKLTSDLYDEIDIEEGLVYGILKSSDLKGGVIRSARKATLVTQQKIGQDTSYIKSQYPKTFAYLTQNKLRFSARKSAIYKDKPDFSIFGVGDYSFQPFKVAISGLYKTCRFSLVLPQKNKPVMLDDTCYFIGFDKLEFAAYSFILLNSGKALTFLQSITFHDAKRVFTKDILMRIDLLKLSASLSEKEVINKLNSLNVVYNLAVKIDFWPEFVRAITPLPTPQLSIL